MNKKSIKWRIEKNKKKKTSTKQIQINTIFEKWNPESQVSSGR